MTSGEREPETAADAVPAAGSEPDPDGGDDRGDHGADSGDADDATVDDDHVGREWTREDLKRSAVGGVAAYLASYALLYLWFLSEGRTSRELVDWRWVGWMLYHGQFVPLDVSPGGASENVATITETVLGDWSNVVPALLLSVAVAGIAGFLLARARDPADPDTAVETGASLVVGYLPPAVLGVVVFAGQLPNGVHVRPSPIWGPVVTGLVFPAVVGAFGGLAFVAWRQRSGEGNRGATGGSASDGPAGSGGEVRSAGAPPTDQRGVKRPASRATRESSDPVEEEPPDGESPEPRH